jgi:hypothetical protein
MTPQSMETTNINPLTKDIIDIGSGPYSGDTSRFRELPELIHQDVNEGLKGLTI